MAYETAAETAKKIRIELKCGAACLFLPEGAQWKCSRKREHTGKHRNVGGHAWTTEQTRITPEQCDASHDGHDFGPRGDWPKCRTCGVRR